MSVDQLPEMIREADRTRSRSGRTAGRARQQAGALLLFSALAGCAGPASMPAEHPPAAADVELAQAIRLAESVRASGDVTGAAVFFRRAHVLAPDSPAPLIGMAEAAAASGAGDTAADLYRRAITVDPGNPAARLGYGRVLLSLGRAQAAQPELRAAVDASPDDPRAYLALGAAYELSGDAQSAQATYQEGLRRLPGHPSLQNNLALSLAVAGRAPEAIGILQELSRDMVGGPRVRQNLALVHALAGQYEQAEAIAAQDLKGSALRSNLAYFRSLKDLSGVQLAEAVLCGCTPDTSARTAQGAAVREDLSLASLPVQAPIAQKASAVRTPSADLELSANRLKGSMLAPKVAGITHGSKTLVVVDGTYADAAAGLEEEPQAIPRSTNRRQRADVPSKKAAGTLASLGTPVAEPGTITAARSDTEASPLAAPTSKTDGVQASKLDHAPSAETESPVAPAAGTALEPDKTSHQPAEAVVAVPVADPPAAAANDPQRGAGERAAMPTRVAIADPSKAEPAAHTLRVDLPRPEAVARGGDRQGGMQLLAARSIEVPLVQPRSQAGKVVEIRLDPPKPDTAKVVELRLDPPASHSTIPSVAETPKSADETRTPGVTGTQ